jgi:hypothetical protein
MNYKIGDELIEINPLIKRVIKIVDILKATNGSTGYLIKNVDLETETVKDGSYIVDYDYLRFRYNPYMNKSHKLKELINEL